MAGIIGRPDQRLIKPIVSNLVTAPEELFEPDDLPGLVLWLDAADESTITPTPPGGPVTQWNDKSGNSNNATASGSERPTYIQIAGGINPSLSFDGLGNFMTIADASSLDWGNTVSFFVVYDIAGGQSSGGRIILTKGTAGRLFWDSATTDIQFDNTVDNIITSNTAQPEDSTTQLTVTKGTATGRLRVDGTDQISTSDFTKILTDNNSGLEIGGCPIGPVGLLQAKFSSVIIYNRELTTPEVDQVEDYQFRTFP